MFQGAKQNEESLLPPGEGQDEGIINGKLYDPLTPTLSLREREPSGKLAIFYRLCAAGRLRV